MSIYHSAVKKPISTILIFIGMAILGVFSLSKLPLDLYPDMEFNQLMILTSYPGAGPEDVETNVSKVLENTLNSVAKLKHLKSDSKENLSLITMQFNEGTDIVDATNDVRDKLSAISQSLPDGAQQPMIFKFSADDIPILILSVESSKSSKALEKILNEKVSTPLARIDGVGGVSISGAPVREVQVYCDPAKLEAYNLSIASVSAIIQAQNRNISVGTMDLGNTTTSIRVQGELQDTSEIGNLIVGSFAGGNVYVRDVARIEDTTAERMQHTFTNNSPGSTIIVTKQSGANSVQIAQKVLNELPKIKETLPSDIEIKTVWDSSQNIVSSINSLTETIGITFLVVMLVVLLFLGRWRATFIIVLTIPVSLVGSFIYLMFSGSTLNIISLSSLSIAIGMVVDDAIVVLENITEHIEKGSYPKQAAVHATREVAISVIASTLTMLAVFLPLTMIGGMAGMIFSQLGWMVSIVMIISTICALTLTPSLCAHMLRYRAKDKKSGSWVEQLFAPFQKVLDKMEKGYAHLLNWCLRHRKTTIFGALGVFVFSLLLSPLIKSEFMPSVDNSYSTASIEFPVGTNIDISLQKGEALTALWLKKYKEISSITYSAGQPEASNAFASMQNNGSNILTFNIKFVEPDKRKLSIYELADLMRQDIANVPGVKEYSLTPGGGGFGGQTTVDLEVYGHDFEQTNQIANAFIAAITQKKSCSSAISDRKDFLPEYNVRFDTRKLAELGLNQGMASSYLYNSVNGSLATYYREDGDEYPVRVRLAPEFRTQLQDLQDIVVYTPTGQAVKMGELASIEQHYTPPSIKHKDRTRVVTVSCVATAGTPLSDLVKDANAAIKKIDIPEGVSYKVGGTYETQQETFSDMGILLILIVLLVFIVMAAEFESLLDPFVIMFSIPFSFTGVLIGLTITRVPLSIIALIGAIMLVGIVVKNGIVLIDYTRLCRERGMSIVTACVAAGKSRLRPVLMTTMTTVLGMIPMALGLGEGSETWQPMGITVVFGLTVSTLITLVLIPTLFASFTGRGIHRLRKRAAREQRRSLSKA